MRHVVKLTPVEGGYVARLAEPPSPESGRGPTPIDAVNDLMTRVIRGRETPPR